MYKIEWDKETGGVLLSSKVSKETLGISPRPVWFEELDLLGLDKLGYVYPQSEAPLMWAVNKQYFYRGDLVFQAKGANLYDSATITIMPGFENLELIPIDVKKMIERNRDIMFLLESEAIEFIRETFFIYSTASKKFNEIKANQLDFEAIAASIEQKQKRKMAIVKEECDSFDVMPLDIAEQQGKQRLLATKIDVFLASFSGGKDSQVVLDLCTRALPPSVFEVIYSDTGYELPSSLDLYEDVKRHYSALYPGLKFSTARNHASVLSYWDKIGTPSDTHRWCCSVMKTAPLYRSLKVPGTNKQAKVLTFDGVRAEESARRGNYERMGKGVKHSTVVNAHPILYWNTSEIFLYLFSYALPVNDAYRLGKSRVGCITCPYSSEWDDMIVSRCYGAELEPFISRIYDWSKQEGVKDLEVYLKERKWKFRASGKFMKISTQVNFKNSPNNFYAQVKSAKLPITAWLPVLGEFTLFNISNEFHGDIKYKNTVYSFEIKGNDTDYTFYIKGIKDLSLISLLKRVIYKAAYCINCESCEVECPTGALSVFPKVNIDLTKCIHCHKCLNFHDKGCIVANSISMTTETNIKAKAGIDRYNTFGLHEEWMSEFLLNPTEFWDYNGLGPKQVPSFKNWLKEAEIIDTKLNLTEIGKVLSEIYVDDPNLVWSVVLTNLAKNSFIVNWFLTHIVPGQIFDKNSISENISEEYPVYGKRTVDNAVSALFQLFKYCPTDSAFAIAEEIEGKQYRRKSFEDLSDAALAYSLYRYAENVGYKSFRVSDLKDSKSELGPFVEFGISLSGLEKILRTLNSANNRLLVAELNMGLDHITLREDVNPISILKTLI